MTHSQPTEGRLATLTRHNIDFKTKVSKIDISYSVFSMKPTLNYTVTKAAHSLQYILRATSHNSCVQHVKRTDTGAGAELIRKHFKIKTCTTETTTGRG